MRVIVEQLTIVWKQPVVLESRPGGNGIPAMDAIKAAMGVPGVETLTYREVQERRDVVRKRLAAYVENTQPLVDWYRKRPMFRAIDGDRPLVEVARAFDAAVLDCLGGNPGE